MNETETRQFLIDCFDDTEWHLSLWFPRVTREVVGIPSRATDAEIQHCLLDLIREGILETGAVEGSEFVAAPFSLQQPGPCPDLYIRTAAGVAHSR